MNMHYMLLHIA